MVKHIFLYPIKDNTYRPIDGDTLSVLLDKGFGDTKTVSLRFNGLNAPESRTRRKLEKEAGLLVKSIVAKWLILNMDKQLYATSEVRPKYANRAIGRIWAGAEDNCLNNYLLDLKVVKTYSGGKRGFSDEELNEIISNCKSVLDTSNESSI